MGKGSRQRPTTVPMAEADANFESIFGKRIPTYMRKMTEEKEMQVRVEENVNDIGKCGCGRSPTGKCIGWHGLTEEMYQARLAEFNALTENEKSKSN
jgi:hypothetical protein